MKKEAAAADHEKTELEVPVTMHIESTPAAPEPDKKEAEEDKPADPRAEALSSIYENRNKVLEKELDLHDAIIGKEKEEKSEEETSSTQKEEDKPADQTEKKVDPQASAAQEGAKAPDQAQRHQLIVNGQAIELTQEELMRAASMGMASHQRFEEAARLRREAEVIANQNRQPVQPAQTHSAPAGNAPPPVLTDEEAKSFAQRLNYGSDEDQANAIRDVVTLAATRLGQQPNTALNPDELVGQATTRALAIIDHQTALQTVGSEYGEVFQDKYLSNMAGNIAAELRMKYVNLGTPKSNLDIYRESLGYVRDTYIKPASAPQDDPAKNTSSVQAASPAANSSPRLERKRAAPQPPAAANKVAAEEPVNQAPTGSQIVAQMRKSRHQPV